MTTNMDRWVRALRSDEYGQTDSTLKAYMGVIQPEDFDDPADYGAAVEKRGDATYAYCCLGVGCQVSDPADTWNWEGHDLPPIEFVKWLGVEIPEGYTDDTVDPYIDFPQELMDRSNPSLQLRKVVTCSVLNDSMHMSFDAIADLVDYFGVWVKP